MSGDTPSPLGINDGSPFSSTIPFGFLQSTMAFITFLRKAISISLLQRGRAAAAASRRKKADPDPVRTAFRRCQQRGWIPFFQKAAQANSFEPELLMGIGYRESNLAPNSLKVAGDNGHGYGLMQIDIRSYPNWVDEGNWKDPKACISMGAEVLALKRDEIESRNGEKNIEVKDNAGHIYHFDGKEIAGPDLLRVTVAAYNCGMWAYYHYSKGDDVDKGTTGKDYSKDVLKKAARFKQLLDSQDSPGGFDLQQFFSHFA
jgi:hypothetical protein